MTNMIMIIMKAAMEAGMMTMVMEEREIMGIKMMIGIAEMETLMVVMVIVMAEIMKIAMAEMGTGMMTTVEVIVLTVTKMGQLGALIETTLTMVNHQIGTYQVVQRMIDNFYPDLKN